MSSASSSASDPDVENHGSSSKATKKKRPRDNPEAVPASPLAHHLHEHHHEAPAIDNSGILAEGEEAHPPPAVAVSGAPTLGGTVVWRASADPTGRSAAKADLWEKVNEAPFTPSSEPTVRSVPIDPSFKPLGVMEPVRGWVSWW